jgi:hypothetical protein
VPVCYPPTRSAVHCGSRIRVDTEAAAGREENDTYWDPATASLLVLSSLIQLLADLVDFESLGGRADELIGVSRTDLSHKRTCIRNHYRKKRKRDVLGKRSSLGKVT